MMELMKRESNMIKKIVAVLIIALCIFAVGCSNEKEHTNTTSEVSSTDVESDDTNVKRKIIIDTDTAGDDASALMIAAKLKRKIINQRKNQKRNEVDYFEKDKYYRKLTMYNFTELIAASISIHKAIRKYVYSINFSAAANVCRKLFLDFCTPDFVEAVIQKHTCFLASVFFLKAPLAYLNDIAV